MAPLPIYRITIRFKPPSNVSAVPYDSSHIESLDILKEKTREELISYGQQLLEQAAEESFLETGKNLDDLPQMLDSAKVVMVKAERGNEQHSIMKTQRLSDMIDPNDTTPFALMFTVKGAEPILLHPDLQEQTPQSSAAAPEVKLCSPASDIQHVPENTLAEESDCPEPPAAVGSSRDNAEQAHAPRQGNGSVAKPHPAGKEILSPSAASFTPAEAAQVAGNLGRAGSHQVNSSGKSSQEQEPEPESPITSTVTAGTLSIRDSTAAESTSAADVIGHASHPMSSSEKAGSSEPPAAATSSHRKAEQAHGPEPLRAGMNTLSPSAPAFTPAKVAQGGNLCSAGPRHRSSRSSRQPPAKTPSIANVSRAESAAEPQFSASRPTPHVATHSRTMDPIRSDQRPEAPCKKPARRKGKKEHSRAQRPHLQPGNRDSPAPAKARAPGYQQSERKQEPLEVFQYTEEIVDLVWGKAALLGQAVCIAGHTGCGKSTGLPVVLMREIQRRGQKGRVVVTQPRRLAATKLARRVAETLGEPLGQSVAYAVGQDVSEGYTTSALLFVTTGWLREKLLHDPNFFTGFSHVIRDEAHERSIELDMLALLIRRHRRSCAPVSPAVTPTVIVMSATMEAGVFAKYFGGEEVSDMVPEPLTVGGRRYPVVEFTLDDLIQQDEIKLEQLAALALADVLQCPRVVAEAAVAICGKVAKGLVRDLSDLQKVAIGFVLNKAKQMLLAWLNTSMEKQRCEITDELASLGAQLAIKCCTSPAAAAVLIFLPGMREIGQLRSALYDRAGQLGLADRLFLCILHSAVPAEEQELAMGPPPAGCFKVVLATNIAESSITIPDVTVVIDYCMQRVNSYDMKRDTEVLQLNWTSLASQKQRAGRAGRVGPGVVFRMVTSRCRSQHIEYDLPAILRESLAGTVLSLEATMRALGKAADLLQEAPQPPEPDQVAYALDYLYKTGALLAEDDQITSMGRLASRLPTSVALSRLIHLALAAGTCEVPAVVTAAGMALRTEPFSKPKRQLCDSPKEYVSKMRESQRHRGLFEDGSYCEPLMLTRCFQAWTDGPKTQAWALRHGLSLGRMKEFEAGVVELCLRLEDAIDHAGLAVEKGVTRSLAALASLADPEARVQGGPRGPTPQEVVSAMHGEPMLMWCLLSLAFAPNLMVGIPQRTNHSWQTDVTRKGFDADKTLRLRGGKKDPGLPSELMDEVRLRDAVQHMTGDGSVTGCVIDHSSGAALVQFRADRKQDNSCTRRFLPSGDLPRAAKLLLAVGDAYVSTRQEYSAKINIVSKDGTESEVRRADWKMPIAWHRVTAGGQGPAQRVTPDIRGPLGAMGGQTCQSQGDLVAVVHQLTMLGKSQDVLSASSTLLLPRHGGLAAMLLLCCLPVTASAELAPRLVATVDETGSLHFVKLKNRNGLNIDLFPLKQTALQAAQRLRGCLIKALLEGTGELRSSMAAAIQLASETELPKTQPGATAVDVQVRWAVRTGSVVKTDPMAPLMLEAVIAAARSMATSKAIASFGLASRAPTPPTQLPSRSRPVSSAPRPASSSAAGYHYGVSGPSSIGARHVPASNTSSSSSNASQCRIS